MHNDPTMYVNRGGEWGPYRDTQSVAKLGLNQTIDALLKVLQAQHRLALVADKHLADGRGSVAKVQAVQALSPAPHL